MSPIGSPEKRGPGFRSLREHLDALEAAGLLRHVTAQVDLKHEIGAISARCIDRGGPALLFENIGDYPGMSLATNLLSSIRHLALVFGTDEDEHEIYPRILQGLEFRLPPVVLDTGPCKEEVYHGDAVDLYRFPTPLWHELDGGPYIGTTAGVITRDPTTGFVNMGTYRAMIIDRNTLSMTGQVRTARDPSGLGHVAMNEAAGRSTPVAIALGMDPYLTLASGTGVPIDAEGLAEIEAAGTWRGSPTELVPCETSDLLVPAQAEIVLEGEFVPQQRVPEGPHGEATGFYGRNPEAWVIKIDCVTHRKNPISYGLVCRLTEDYPRSLLRSGSYQARLMREAGLSSIREARMVELGWQALLIVSAQIRDPEDPRRIMEAAWRQLNFRWVIVVDEDCDVRDWNDVMWRVVSLADPQKDIGLSHDRQGWRSRADEVADEFQPPEHGLGIDATRGSKGKTLPPINTISHELRAKVAARWSELGLP